MRNTKRSKPLGLIAAGEVDRELAAITGFHEHLGPVKAGSLRVASRMVNRLQAGYPVAEYGEMEQCRTILVAVPGAQVKEVAGDLGKCGIKLTGKSLVVFGSGVDEASVGELRALGAAVAILRPTGRQAARKFALEGDRQATAPLKRMLQRHRRSFVEITRGNRELYEAGLLIFELLFPAVADACLDCLRQAGLTAREARAALEAEFARVLKKTGKTGSGASRQGMRAEELALLEQRVPAAARLLREGGVSGVEKADSAKA